jgi:hypothetical protein
MKNKRVVICAVLSLFVALLFYKLNHKPKSHSSKILTGDLNSLRDILLTKSLDRNDGWEKSIVDYGDINESNYIFNMLVDTPTNYFDLLTMSNGIVLDNFGDKIHIELIHFKKPELNGGSIDFKIWSDGRNKINENGSGDDVAASYFPK